MNPDEVIYRGKYVWHRLKNEKNKKEHEGLSFEEAIGVFDDPFSVEEYDIDNSITEDRYNLTGNIGGKWIVVTVTSTPRGELIRIISARKADSFEKEAYYDNIRKTVG
ncbi:MAG: BrnT family toxin [Treponema sp.]|nr:BrnT family toxin [Treponema sp.]